MTNLPNGRPCPTCGIVSAPGGPDPVWNRARRRGRERAKAWISRGTETSPGFLAGWSSGLKWRQDRGLPCPPLDR